MPFEQECALADSGLLVSARGVLFMQRLPGRVEAELGSALNRLSARLRLVFARATPPGMSEQSPTRRAAIG